MAEPLRVTFARWCRDARADLDITQQALADAVGVSRSLIAAYESGRAVPGLDMVERIGGVLGLEVRLTIRRPVILGPRHERDLVHARCSGYAGRMFELEGLLVAREVEIVEGRGHGWVDLLVFDPRTHRLFIVEIKTSLDDVGAIERQIGWYERRAIDAARTRGWDPRSVCSWLLMLASDEVDEAVARQRDVLDAAFPDRAGEMTDMLAGTSDLGNRRGLALIDPMRRRRGWLLPSRADGRRTAAPFRDRADAAAHLTSRRAGVSGRRPGSRQTR
jgi:transcriptional regulator with XRE-family HTH domain